MLFVIKLDVVSCFFFFFSAADFGGDGVVRLSSFYFLKLRSSVYPACIDFFSPSRFYNG